MNKDEITAWALANGWQMMDGFPSLTKPPRRIRPLCAGAEGHRRQRRNQKPAGKWKKSPRELFQDRGGPETLPGGLGLGTFRS